MADREDNDLIIDGSPLGDRIRGRLAALKEERTPRGEPIPDPGPAPEPEAQPAGPGPVAAMDAETAQTDQAQAPATDRYAELIKSYRKLKERLNEHIDTQAKCERLLHAHFRTIDDLTRALAVMEAQAPSAGEGGQTGQILRNMIMGVQQVRDRLFEVLMDENELEYLEPAPGEPYDAQRHEAVETVARGDAEPHSILEVLEPGYVLEGKVLRPARVKVAARTE